MATEYISREAAIEIVINYEFENCPDYMRDFATKLKSAVCSDIRTDLQALPAADVRPVKRGRWTPGDCFCPVCKKDKFDGLDADIWADWTPPFCPNCGADMREVKADG